jgi:hypothetical protein
MGIRGEIHSTVVQLPARTYFFNVKENRAGGLYLNIVESKNKEGGGFERASLVVFEEDAQKFLAGFDESLKILEKTVREKRKSGKPKPSINEAEAVLPGAPKKVFRKRADGAAADSKPARKTFGARPKNDRPRRDSEKTYGGKSRGEKPKRAVVHAKRRDNAGSD